MKQLLQNLRTGKTIIADVPIPIPQRGEALIQTVASVISAGTERMLIEFAEKSLVGKARSRPDLVRQLIDKARREGLITAVEAAFNRLDQAMPLGYSSSGIVVELGEGMVNYKVGQRVACAGGGYAVHAEFSVVPRNLIAPLPDEVDFESAAFTTLGAIALHGFRLAETQVAERVAVIGLGLLGLLAAGIAKAAGCSVFGVDLDPDRVALAERMDVVAVSRAEAVPAAENFSQGRGCDAILICADTSSSDPLELAGAIARDRARVVAVGAVGLHIPRKIYYEKELVFINSRSYGPGRYDPAYEQAGQDYPIGYVRWTEGRNLEGFIELLKSRRIEVKSLITHRFSIDHADQAYRLITGKRKEPFLGVLLTYPNTIWDKDNPAVERQKIVVRELEPYPGGVVGLAGTVKLGVLGAGNFATAVMLPMLKKIRDVELVGIASTSGVSARHAASRFGFDYACSDEMQVLEDPQINTIAILTPHHLHARQVIAGLRAGKHVFCEKPLALDEEGLFNIETLLKAGMNTEEGSDRSSDSSSENLAPLKKVSPLLMVGFNRRFSPLAYHLKSFLEGCKEPMVAYYRVNAGYIPLNHWVQDLNQGGGRIIGEGCHFVDFLTFLVGSSPVVVSAQGLPDMGRYREDNVVLNLGFADGSIGVISYLANGDRAFPKERLEVFCAGRVAVLNDFRSLELIHNGKRRVWRSRMRQDKGHRSEWEAFISAMKTGGLPPIPYEQVFGVSRATLALVKALRTGRVIYLGI